MCSRGREAVGRWKGEGLGVATNPSDKVSYLTTTTILPGVMQCIVKPATSHGKLTGRGWWKYSVWSLIEVLRGVFEVVAKGKVCC